MQKRAWTILVIALVAALALAGCSASGTKEGASKKVLTIGTPYTIETLNPFTYSSDGDRYVISQIQESLVESSQGRPTPLLAESWTNPDNTTWIFKLRNNAYWHDDNEVYAKGSKERVKAQDVVDVFKFVMDPANKAKRQAKLAAIVKSVEAVDESTVKFVTKEPYAFFTGEINSVPIFSMKAYKQLGAEKFAKFPIGTGPFKFVEYKTDDQVVLKRNDAYHIKPNLEKVVFRIIPDKSVSAIALQTGEIDISLQIPPTEVDKVTANGKVHIVPNTTGWYRYAAFNFDNPLFQDLKVRQAIRMSIDMSAAVKAIFNKESLAEPAYGPVPPGILGRSDEWKSLSSYNPEKAKQLLAEAGWKPGADGILTKDGKPFKFVLKTPNDVNRSKLGVIMATQLKQIGIACTPQAQEWATHLEDIRKGNVEMFLMGGGSTDDGLLYMFHTAFAKGGSHDTRYKNPELDALLDKARAIVNPAEREILWEKAARMTIMDVVHVPGYNEFVQIGVSNRVKDFDKDPTPFMSLVSTLRNVSVVDSASK